MRLSLAFDVAETHGPGHAVALAAEAVRARVPLVVAVGGDGTLNEVGNGVAPLRAECPVTVGALMIGRGRDACRNLGLVRDPHRAARRLTEGRVVSRDLGLAVWPGGRRFFLGWAGAGFDAVVAERAGVVVCNGSSFGGGVRSWRSGYPPCTGAAISPIPRSGPGAPPPCA